MSAVTKTKQTPRLYYGWIIVGVVAMASFSNTPQTFPVLSIFLKPMTQEFGWSRTTYTGATTLGTLLGGLIALGVGPLVDRFGPRWIMVGGGLVMGGTMVLTAFVHNLWQFYLLQSSSRMVAMGVLGLTTSVILPKWFIAKRGSAIAISGLGGRAGNAVMPLLAQFIVVMAGWRWSWGITGFITLALCVAPSAIFLRRRPEDMGLFPDGAAPGEASKSTTTTSKGGKAKKRGAEVSLTFREVTREPSFYFLTAAFALSFLYLAALNLHMIPYFEDKGVSAQIAVIVVAVWSAAAGLGGLLMGFLADRISVKVLLPVAFGYVAFSFVVLLFVRAPGMAIAWGFMQGLMGGGLGLLQQLIFADYYGRESLGAISGVVWPAQMVTNAIGPIAASMAYDLTGSYTTIFLVFGFLALVSAACTLLARPPLPKHTTANVSPVPMQSGSSGTE